MAPAPVQSNIERFHAPLFSVRGIRVILDSDLARLYGVTTKRLNQALKRNRSRFPEDFAFQLSAIEFSILRSPASLRRAQVSDSRLEKGNWSQSVTSSDRRRGIRYRPWAFTEHGALMAANVLRSKRAVQMSVYVVRAFVRMREQVAANVTIMKRLAEIDRTLLRHDTTLRELYRKLLPLLAPPPEPTKRRIGF